MKLKIIGSSSSGNCYLLETEYEILIMECGIMFDKIQKAIDFNLHKVVGCLLTHSHSDHAYSVNSIVAHGIDLYTSGGTLKELGLETHYRARRMTPLCKYKIGNFTVKPFVVNHDTAEPFGFIIDHREMGRTVFITDTEYVNYRFEGLNQIVIEANYDEGIMEENIISGRTETFIRNRTIGSHMSFQTCKDFLKANDLSAVNNIVLIHLSNGNSNAAMFQSELEKLTSKNITIADAGMEIDFNKIPF